MPVKVAVTGALGRMGSGIIKSIKEQKDMQLICAVEASGNPNAGRDIGEILGIGKMGVEITTSDRLDEMLKNKKPDILVDFTNANAAVETIKIAAQNRVNIVVGTTGFSKEHLKEIEEAVESSGISAVISPNMATGVNIFFKAAKEVAKMLGNECDIEIIEAHHRLKKDAPSGTALRAGELIAEAVGSSIEKNGVFGRKRGITGERSRSEIGFHAIRGGDIVGEHTILFAGDGERLEITHRATSRQAFVNGAIKAVRFIFENKNKGRIYSMWDVLGI